MMDLGPYDKQVLRLAAWIARVGRLAAPDASASAHSRLCGSRITIDLKLDGDVITDYAHELRASVIGQAVAADGTSSIGPHAHVVSTLMRKECTHAPAVPIPRGCAPCTHQRFQRLLMQFGEPALWQLERHVAHDLEQCQARSIQALNLSRHERAAVRVALPQWVASDRTNAALPTWTAAFNGASAANGEV
jgi:hypothetical protein